MQTTLYARTLITQDGLLSYPVITIDEGRILRIEAGSPNDSTDTLTAAFFDIHVHGAVGRDFMAATPAEIACAGSFLATRGVAYYLPTTVTGPVDHTLTALEHIADAIESPAPSSACSTGLPTPLSTTLPTIAATPVGIHLEGPFVSPVKRGVHPPASILGPDIALFDRFQQAARGHIRLLTIAPELPHALDLIRHATAQGVRVSLGHSNATQAEALAGIAAGATSATHTFNAMRALDHREPGILGTILDRDDLYAEAICDGVHVDPAMIRLWLKMKGESRGILVTDGMSATGMPDGTYMLGDFPVELKNGTCLSNGTLAGSVLTMDRAVANVQRFTGTSLATAIHLGSRNPAEMVGLPDLGRIAPGCPANFNVYDENNHLKRTILAGQTVQQ